MSGCTTQRILHKLNCQKKKKKPSIGQGQTLTSFQGSGDEGNVFMKKVMHKPTEIHILCSSYDKICEKALNILKHFINQR